MDFDRQCDLAPFPLPISACELRERGETVEDSEIRPEFCSADTKLIEKTSSIVHSQDHASKFLNSTLPALEIQRKEASGKGEEDIQGYITQQVS